MNTIETNRQQVSDLADGLLREAAFAQAVRMAAEEQDARETWHAYHVIGDVLRSAELARCAAKPDFMGRLQARLAAEPVHMRPTTSYQAAPPVVVTGGQEAANTSVFRWKLFAGVASCVAVAAVGWNLLGTLGPGPTGNGVLASGGGASPPVVGLASSNAVADATSSSMVMIRDPHLDALLAAHKQFGGTSALQGPAGFLRNATFETPGR